MKMSRVVVGKCQKKLRHENVTEALDYGEGAYK